MRVVSVFGTRPEAIKMAPVVKALEANSEIESHVCLTGQHREMLEQVVRLFDLKPDLNLDVMQDSQGLTHVTSAVLKGLERAFEEIKPDYVLVHGDTTTTMAAAMAAFYQQIPVGHVEAGLRTGNIYSPWPEEMNRKLTGGLSTLHFAPTETARSNLNREGINGGSVEVTGNTVIDALYWVRDNRLSASDTEMSEKFPFLNANKRMILVTGHRRENHDGGIEGICRAMAKLAERGDVQVVYPVHLNPAVQATAQAVLKGVDDVHLIPPQDYLPFVWLMNRAYLKIPAASKKRQLGKPILVRQKIQPNTAPEASDARNPAPPALLLNWPAPFIENSENFLIIQ
ncbi:UNVERIFIED_CONTAM: hypothetical protein GTU68_033561 [Idotea baltica]|nr:hypothetical protein [Idotea baltica]